MAAQIIVKATGKASEAASNSIQLDAPSVVRLDVDQSQVANLERAGDDLVVRLTDGQAIRVEQYYVQNNGVGSDLVLRDGAQRLWLAHPEVAGAGRFTLLGELNDLVAAGGAVAAAGGGGFVLPAVLGLAGAGAAGFRAIATCGGGATPMMAQLGTTRDPNAHPVWGGGMVAGYIGHAPSGQSLIGAALHPQATRLMLIAAEPVAGLAANPAPDLESVPNNHLAYAVQWFLFAGLAVVIYILALRRKGSPSK